MGLKDLFKFATTPSPDAGTGKHKKRGKHAAPMGGVQCNHHWTDANASYPHVNHRCGDAPHNRGDHHCYGGDNWKCTASTSYK